METKSRILFIVSTEVKMHVSLTRVSINFQEI